VVDAELLAGVVGCAVVVVGFRPDEPSGGQAQLPAIPSRWCCMKPCGRLRGAGSVRPFSSSTAPVGGSWRYPACTKSSVGVVTLLMPPPCWSGSGPGRRAGRSRRPRASGVRRRPWLRSRHRRTPSRLRLVGLAGTGWLDAEERRPRCFGPLPGGRVAVGDGLRRHATRVVEQRSRVSCTGCILRGLDLPRARRTIADSRSRGIDGGSAPVLLPVGGPMSLRRVPKPWGYRCLWRHPIHLA